LLRFEKKLEVLGYLLARYYHIKQFLKLDLWICCCRL